jgi:spore coat protein A
MALVTLALGVGQASAVATPLVPTSVTKYVDPLPIPPVAQQTAPGSYDLHMMQGTAIFHSQLPPTTVWGYGGGYLGPTIEARTNQPFTVRWYNDLPATHILASSIDYSLDGMMPSGIPLPESRAVTHLHGGHVSEASDGNADQWFLPGDSRLDYYPNDQQASTLWYHDHALGTTRLNPYAGLAGFYIVRDAYEDSLNLPGGPNDAAGTNGPFDVPLVIQDKSFTVDAAAGTSALSYATTGILPLIHPQWVPEFFGDTIAVNGKLWPYLNVEPRKYRFRLLNGSNARFYGLTLVSAKEGTKFKPAITQIGGEGGLLPAVVPLQQLLLAPGERADVIIDFSKAAGMTLVLKNNAKAPYPAGESPDQQTTGQIMQFRVGTTLSHRDTSVIPTTLRPIPRLTPTFGAPVRDVKMTEILDPLTGDPTKLQLEDKGWMDRPVTLTPKLGDTEIWQLINTTGDTHPMHLHLVQFQVLSSQNFNVAKYLTNGNVLAPTLVGSASPPAPNESGWEDTIQVDPGEVVRIIANYDHAGLYPIHCHILEHEENDMMRPFQIMPAG